MAGIREWALKGAEERLVEIAAEARRIFEAFPELRENGRGSATAPVAQPDTPQLRRRPKMSAEARKRIAEAQRKRWAVWKAQKENGATPLKTNARQRRRKATTR